MSRGKWECSCTWINGADVTECQMCHAVTRRDLRKIVSNVAPVQATSIKAVKLIMPTTYTNAQATAEAESAPKGRGCCRV